MACKVKRLYISCRVVYIFLAVFDFRCGGGGGGGLISINQSADTIKPVFEGDPNLTAVEGMHQLIKCILQFV